MSLQHVPGASVHMRMRPLFTSRASLRIRFTAGLLVFIMDTAILSAASTHAKDERRPPPAAERQEGAQNMALETDKGRCNSEIEAPVGIAGRSLPSLRLLARGNATTQERTAMASALRNDRSSSSPSSVPIEFRIRWHKFLHLLVLILLGWRSR